MVNFQIISRYQVLALHLTFTLQISYFLRIRILDEENTTANCTRITENTDDFAQYKCEALIDEKKAYKIASIASLNDFQFAGQKNVEWQISSLANVTSKNLTFQTAEIKRIAILYITSLEVNGQNFTFTGYSNHPFIEDKDKVLMSFDEGEGHLKNVTCKILLLDQETLKFKFDCYSEYSINAPLNGAMGILLDDGRQVMLYMAENQPEMLNIGINYQSLYKRRKSNGLSGGAIVVIVISLVVILISIAVIVMMLRKKSAHTAPFEESALGFNMKSISQ